MIKSPDFVDYLYSSRLRPFLMVPCSIFKPAASWMLKNNVEMIFPPNEAQAMGFAVGSYSVTGDPAVIFLQNSGLNNIANCQTSLNLLYKIPVLLVVSWRGEHSEAPEHNIMGANLEKFFEVLQIPFKVLTDDWQDEMAEMIRTMKAEKRPAAVVIRQNTFVEEKYLLDDFSNKYSLSRFEAIKIIKEALKNEAVFISTNGRPSRDSFAALPSPDFYMMGSMGHAFSIGAGTAWQLKSKNSDLKTVVLDGDGGCLMHLGSLALVGLEKIKKSNLIYLVLDNEAYESTGSQPTLSPGVDFVKVAEGLGFPQVFSVASAEDLKEVIGGLETDLASFIHIKINRQKKDAPRVSDQYTCEEIAEGFQSNFFKK